MGKDGSNDRFLTMQETWPCMQAIGKQPVDSENLKINDRVRMTEGAIGWRQWDGMGSLLYVEGFCIGKNKSLMFK